MSRGDARTRDLERAVAEVGSSPTALRELRTEQQRRGVSLEPYRPWIVCEDEKAVWVAHEPTGKRARNSYLLISEGALSFLEGRRAAVDPGEAWGYHVVAARKNRERRALERNRELSNSDVYTAFMLARPATGKHFESIGWELCRKGRLDRPTARWCGGQVHMVLPSDNWATHGFVSWLQRNAGTPVVRNVDVLHLTAEQAVQWYADQEASWHQ